MTDSPSAGWRAVYEWLHVPMTPRYAAASGEASSGETTTMSDRQNQQSERVKYAKRKCREIAADLESAQDAATLRQLVEEIEQAGVELAYVKSEIEEES